MEFLGILNLCINSKCVFLDRIWFVGSTRIFYVKTLSEGKHGFLPHFLFFLYVAVLFLQQPRPVTIKYYNQNTWKAVVNEAVKVLHKAFRTIKKTPPIPGFFRNIENLLGGKDYRVCPNLCLKLSKRHGTFILMVRGMNRRNWCSMRRNRNRQR